MMRLSFVGVGPQRTASSWLDAVLRLHPEIALPVRVKETLFFDDRYGRGFDWYESHFAESHEQKKVGEIGPTYFDNEEACRRLVERFPELRVIVNVRNPVDRAVSLFRHHVRKGRVPGDFAIAIEIMPRIVTSGHYSVHSARWESAFGESSVLYVLQEDVLRDPRGVLSSIYEFLNVSKVGFPAIAEERYGARTELGPRSRVLARGLSRSATWLRSRRLHRVANWGRRVGLKRLYSGGEAVSVTEEWRRWLLDTYEADIRWLERRLERSFEEWTRER